MFKRNQTATYVVCVEVPKSTVLPMPVTSFNLVHRTLHGRWPGYEAIASCLGKNVSVHVSLLVWLSLDCIAFLVFACA